MSLYFISLSKGIQASVDDGLLPRALGKENARGIPTRIVFGMALIALLVTLLFVFMKNVSESYWIIEAVVVLGMSLRYWLVFPAAIRLRYTKKHVRRLMPVPGGIKGMWFFGTLSFLMVVFADCMSFIPPAQLHIINIWTFEALLIGGAALFIILPLLSSWYTRRSGH